MPLRHVRKFVEALGGETVGADVRPSRDAPSPSPCSRPSPRASASSSTSGSTTSRSTAARRRSRRARASASAWPRRSARRSSASSTCSTSPASASTRATTRGSSRRRSACATSATPSSSWSTTARRSSPPTTSSTWARARACTAARSSRRARRASSWPTRSPSRDRGSAASASCPSRPSARPAARRAVRVVGARAHNLQGVNAEIPLGLFTCITGVSGSGKSSLIVDTLLPAARAKLYNATAPVGECDRVEGLEHVDKVVSIDQAPIGRTPRSNPATYTGIFALLRDLYSGLPDARARGYKAGRFSFNVKGGRCEACQGDGVLRVEMHFLPDVFVTCDTCAGRRYNRETLEVKYRGLSIADALDVTVEQSSELFGAVPRIADKLEALRKVGLGYLTLGQPATTLSGGEAQRVKLARELSRKATGRTLYVLDEPTTGLHFADIEVLLDGADGSARPGEHHRRHRAQPRRRGVRGLGDRPRTRRRRGRRRDRGGGDAGAGGARRSARTRRGTCGTCWRGARRRGRRRRGGNGEEGAAGGRSREPNRDVGAAVSRCDDQCLGAPGDGARSGPPCGRRRRPLERAAGVRRA